MSGRLDLKQDLEEKTEKKLLGSWMLGEISEKCGIW